MDRSEVVGLLCRLEVQQMSLSERQDRLESMLLEDWTDDPSWTEIDSAVRAELMVGTLAESPMSPRYESLLVLQRRFEHRGSTNEYLQSRLKDLGISIADIRGAPVLLEPCPCCGYRTLDSRGKYDVCRVCWWEDSGADNEHADLPSSPNGGISLTAGRANFILHGACDPSRGESQRDPRTKYAPARIFILEGGLVREVGTEWVGELGSPLGIRR